MRDLESIYHENLLGSFYSTSGKETQELRNLRLVVNHVKTIESLLNKISDKNLRLRIMDEFKFIKSFIDDQLNSQQAQQ